MAKDPAFLFYSDNFQSGTQFLTDEQAGKYIRLMCAQHLHGHLTEKQMLFICKSYDKDIWDKFTKDEEGNYFNVRLQAEIDKRKNFCNSRSLNKKGHFKTKRKKKSYDKHMGNENEDGNVIDIEERKCKFISDVSVFRNQHSDDLLKEFCEYWMEHNEGGKKMRFEMQQIFNISRRLSTWKSNQRKFKNNGKQQITNESLQSAFEKQWAEDAARNSR